MIDNENDERLQRQNKRIVIIMMTAIVAAAICAAIYFNTYGSENSQILRVIDQQGRDTLKYNPDKAIFYTDSKETKILIDGEDQSAIVTGWVQAYNGFGTSSKLPYNASLSKDADTNKWSLDKFDIDTSSLTSSN